MDGTWIDCCWAGALPSSFHGWVEISAAPRVAAAPIKAVMITTFFVSATASPKQVRTGPGHRHPRAAGRQASCGHAPQTDARPDSFSWITSPGRMRVASPRRSAKRARITERVNTAAKYGQALFTCAPSAQSARCADRTRRGV